MTGAAADPSNGYDAVAAQFMTLREQSRVGAAMVAAWAASLPAGATILDLGCGHGVPVSEELMAAGFRVFGVDASPSMTAAFRRRFPDAPVACEMVESSDFFGRRFDGIIAVGLIFLLPAGAQRRLLGRMARALEPRGRLLFTAPAHVCTWQDALTGRTSWSLGSAEYRSILARAGLIVTGEFADDGDNHYYDGVKPQLGSRPGGR